MKLLIPVALSQPLSMVKCYTAFQVNKGRPIPLHDPVPDWIKNLSNNQINMLYIGSQVTTNYTCFSKMVMVILYSNNLFY